MGAGELDLTFLTPRGTSATTSSSDGSSSTDAASGRLARGTEADEDDEATDGGLDGSAALVRRDEVDAERFKVKLSVVEIG